MGIFSNDKNSQAAAVTDDQFAASADGQQPVADPAAVPADDQAMQQSVDDFMNQTAPALNDTTAGTTDFIMTDAPAPAAPPAEEAPHEQIPVHVNTPAATDSQTLPDSAESDDLTSIKLEALKQLSPLMSHLDQSPEERFHTTMMMLQATDDRSMIKKAYEAAQAITDERTRAQALLDVVNEINYFTSNKK